MNPKKKRVTKNKERVDREEQSKYKFDPLGLEVKHPGTAVLLLQCQEQPILLAAAAALSKYGSKSQGNLEVLFDLEIVASVIPLIEHENLFTRRFAAKLLAEMAAIPNVRNFLLDSTYYIPHFANILVNDKDLFMQEFSSAILAEVSKDMFGVAQLLKQCLDMNFLFKRLQSPDPDVKKNNLEIMHNLLRDSTGAKEMIETKDFNLNLLYDLFDSPYREIQGLALNIVGELVSRNQDDHLQNLFRRSNGLQALLKFLDKEECVDLHSEVLRILCLASDNPATIDLLNDIGGIKRLLQYTQDTPNSKFFVEALDVVVRLSHTPLGRKALYTYGIIDHLLLTLSGNVQSNIYEISCHGIGMMTLHNDAAKELTESNCIKNVLDILKNENLKWTIRQAAMFALNRLLKCDMKNCHYFLDTHGQNYLVWLMKQTTGKVPIEILVGAVESLTTIARNRSLRNVIVNSNTVDTACASFELTCPMMNDYKIACCNAIAILCVDKIGRSAFLKAHGPRKLYNLLVDVKSIPVRNAAVQLIQLLCADPSLADAFVQARYLNLFPILDDIFRFKFCPLEPVYVVNCVQAYESSTNLPSPSRSILEDPVQMSIEDLTRTGIFMSSELQNLVMDSKFGRLQCDSCLYDYVELFKCKLVAAESKCVTSKVRQGLANVNYVASRAKMLAKFVAGKMSGPDPLIGCVDHQLEIHLKEIKATIETSIIPLGMLRVGSYLERALLFKAIADRIHLPAALVRGEYGKTWVEVAVPQVEGPVEETSFKPYLDRDTSCPEIVTLQTIPPYSYKDSDKDAVSIDNRQTVFPTKLMKPNFIVDLMDSPGDLIPINCHRARFYYETQRVCDKLCRD